MDRFPERDTHLFEDDAALRHRWVPLISAKGTDEGRQRSGQPKRGAMRQFFRYLGDALNLELFYVRHVDVYLAAYHFLPFVMVLLTLTVNLLLHVLMGLVFPLAADSYVDFVAATAQHGVRRSVAAALDDLATGIALRDTEALAYYWQLFRPYWSAAVAAGLVFVGGMTFGYKLMTMIGDCAIDVCRHVRHRQAKVDLILYSLFTALRHVWQGGLLTVITFVLCLGFELFATAVICFTPHFGIEWWMRDRTVFYLACAITVAQSTWIMKEALRMAMCGQLDEVHVAHWWSTKLPQCRRAACGCLVLFGLGFALESGVAFGLVCISEGLVYLNFLHAYVAGAARAALFTKRITESAYTICVDSTARMAAGALGLPLIVVAGANFYMLDNLPVSMLQLPALLLLIDALAQHTHEHRADIERAAPRSPVDSVNVPSFASSPGEAARAVMAPATQSLSVAAKVWRVVLRALFLTQTRRFSHEAHFKPRNAMRAGMRVILCICTSALTAVCLWTSLQFAPGMMSKFAESIQPMGDGGDGIRVVTGVLTAELYAIGQADRANLVFESDPRRYDRARYDGVCQRRWGGFLHATDLAYFSLLAYRPARTEGFARLFDFWRKNRDGGSSWEFVDKAAVVGAQAFDGDGMWHQHIERSVNASFHHLRDPVRGINVIAVRGTQPGLAIDFLQNVLIFSEVFLYQMSALLVPGAGLIPESIVKDLIRIGSMMDVAILDCDRRRERHHYYHEIESYISTFRATPGQENEAFVLTGHSLGGVIAQIVAARGRIPAVAFSSPGIALLEKKFGVDPDAVDAYITNVVVSNDVVPLIGKLGGSVNYIQCEHRRFDVCHGIELQAIRLWATCAAYREVIAVNGSYALHPQMHERAIAAVQSWLDWK